MSKIGNQTATAVASQVQAIAAGRRAGKSSPSQWAATQVAPQATPPADGAARHTIGLTVGNVALVLHAACDASSVRIDPNLAERTYVVQVRVCYQGYGAPGSQLAEYAPAVPFTDVDREVRRLGLRWSVAHPQQQRAVAARLATEQVMRALKAKNGGVV